MVDNNSCLKYKYLTIKVTAERNPAGAMYDWTYTVTGIDTFKDVNVLGYYDEKKTAPVVLMSNKTIFEYDWTTIPSRIRSGICKGYMDMFKDDKHIIIVSEAVSFENSITGAILGVEDAGFKLSHAFEGYTLQFINPAVYETVESENFLHNLISEEERKKKREEKLDAEWKKRFGSIPEEQRPKIVFEDEIKVVEKQIKKPFWTDAKIGIMALLVSIAFVISLGIIASNLMHRYQAWLDERSAEAMETNVTKTITKNPYSRAQAMALAIDSMSVFEDGTKDSLDVKALADSIYATDLNHRADSIAQVTIKRDSLIAELPKEKKVQIELVAVIEDGITTRKVQTAAVLDTIKESDMKHLTKTITVMATNMAKDRQTEIDTSKTYYRVSKIKTDNFISLE
jgi:hypothetical protein